jgi:hypothetical protein
MTVAAEQTISVGEPVVIEGSGRASTDAVVFEDDGESGYFYAVDVSNDEVAIVDAMHIYTVIDVTDRELASVIKILWDEDGPRAALLINDYLHAVFDFEGRRGYCRNEFPAAGNRWERPEWNDRILEAFDDGLGSA